jgi:1,4-dihydroxy-2-naphthoyl-CoA synthase
MAEYEYLKVERDGPVTVVTINRPEVYNALHPPAHWEFDKVFNEFRDDPEQWIAIITGEGAKAFSAGNDLKYQAEGKGPRDRPATGFAGLTFRYDLDKPVIAAVNGFAMVDLRSHWLAISLLLRRTRFSHYRNRAWASQRSRAAFTDCRVRFRLSRPWA